MLQPPPTSWPADQPAFILKDTYARITLQRNFHPPGRAHLRRETTMREARSYIGGEFAPTSAEELVAIVSGGDEHGAFVLQVYGYWDMVAAFVESGALDDGLV